MPKQHSGFMPQEIFHQMLDAVPMVTFDLILDVENSGVIMARRKIEPYLGKWSLPGLRMYKGERISTTLRRIAAQEVGIKIDGRQAKPLGYQYSREFIGEGHDRHDISTGYVLPLPTGTLPVINENHFDDWQFVEAGQPLPEPIGDMYEYYLNKYREQQAE